MEFKRVYLAFDGKYYKIGNSMFPEKRMKDLRKDNPSIRLLYHNFGGTTEKQLHEIFKENNVFGEWFDLSKKQVDEVLYLIDNKHPDYKDEHKGMNSLEIEVYELRKKLKLYGVKDPKAYFSRMFPEFNKNKSEVYRLDNLWYFKITDPEFNNKLKVFVAYIKKEFGFEKEEPVIDTNGKK